VHGFAERNVDTSDQYTRLFQASQDVIARTPEVVSDLVSRDNYLWAAHNCKAAAEAHINLGLLRWRQGIDPRHNFGGAMEAFVNLNEIVQNHRLSKEDFDMSPVYAAMFLMNRDATLTYSNEASYETKRWSCYQCRVVHALHDREPSAGLAKLVGSHLARNDELPERIFDAYAQLLGLRASNMDVDERVRRAKSTWAERKRDELVTDGPPWNGHGPMNDLYVDIYLAAILKKIGWRGHTVHAWLWD
jgi:hypothetical protein